MAKERVFKDKGLAKAIKATGGLRALARALGMDHATLLRWTRVPYERVLDVEWVTGMPREELRPELHRPARVCIQIG
jgi:DNA-binding transcriptional regulator YdaS (Cro superfamily)